MWVCEREVCVYEGVREGICLLAYILQNFVFAG